jgi:hypothetical protein
MKAQIITIVTAAIFILLAVTNPAMDKYQQFMQQQILQSTENQDGVTKTVGALFGGLGISTPNQYHGKKRFCFLQLLHNQHRQRPTQSDRCIQ